MAIQRLRFESGMGDAMLGKLVFELFRNLWPTGEVVEDDVCREGCFGGADGPNVDVMCTLNVLFVGNQMLNFL